MKSLEELAIIIEVLEEDLKSSSTCQSPTHSPPPFNSPRALELSPAGNASWTHYKLMTTFQSLLFFFFITSYFHLYSPTDSSCDDEYDEIIPSPDSYTAYSPSSECQSLGSPPDCMFSGLQPTSMASLQRTADRGEEWFQQQNSWDPNNSAFFWTQLQKEESQLRATSDADLLGADEHGRMWVWCQCVWITAMFTNQTRGLNVWENYWTIWGFRF